MRLKYKLTISELVILSGIYCFSRHQATLFSLPMIKRYISYYNYNKARYYIGSLVDKGVICISDFRRDQPLYKLTDKGIEVLNAYQDAYNIAMAKYFQDNNIEL
ncbi:MAG: hypothetical protein GYA14_15880 [Ignavibacteria bacterium]|nr:hypothetical protein [Ignavibacteria bacterium]